MADSGRLVPLGMLIGGGYLAWFGAHYFMSSNVKWPSDPIKALLRGESLPVNDIATPVTGVIGPGGSFGRSSTGVGGGVLATTGRESIAAAAQKYVGAGYVWGGDASQIGKWDCSSFVSYVLGHDEGLPLPGGHWGDPGMPPHAHGPTTVTYHLYGSAINRSDVGGGDLIVWPGHIGIAISNKQMVSARNPRDGVGIDNFDTFESDVPVYRRVPIGGSSSSSSSSSSPGGHAVL